MATLRSCGLSSFTTRSPMRTVPAVISSSPATSRSSVDLPQPDGPTTTTSSPSSIPSVQSASACVPSGKTLSTCSNSTLAISVEEALSRLGRDDHLVPGRSHPDVEPAEESFLAKEMEGEGPWIAEPDRRLPRHLGERQLNPGAARERREAPDCEALALGPGEIDPRGIRHPCGETIVQRARVQQAELRCS